MPIPEELKHTLGRALGRIPSGLFIISAAHHGRRSAMLASWVQQAAFDPPCISIALGHDRDILPLIDASRKLAVSILAESDNALMKKFARGIPPDQDPFTDVKIVTTPSGLPVLADSLAWLDAELLHRCDFNADHALLIARLNAGHLLKDAPPFRHTRGNGFHY